MTQLWKSQPELRIKVQHLGTVYIIDATATNVNRHENGFDTATVILDDTQARNYVDRVAADDYIKIEQRDKSESWVTLLDGFILRVEPTLSPEGNTLTVKCDGRGYGLAMTVCGEEYGTQSSHASLDTIREIVKDATHGVIPKWVNNILGTATDSGYNYKTYVEDIAGSMPYMYFPFKPCNKAINDLCDVLQAIKGTNAGPHWMVDTNDRFLLTTVGAHSAAGDNPAQYWSTWWRTDQAGSTLTEGEDFLNFRFQHLGKEANYVLYQGRLKKPGDGDFWTENQSGLWGTADGKADDNADYKVGSYSLKGTYTAPGGGVQLNYPSGNNAAWDFTKIGGRHNIPSISFWFKRDANATAADIRLETWNGGVTTYFLYSLQGTTADTWTYFSLPVGPYAIPNIIENFVGWTPDPGAGGDWTEIDCIRFRAGVAVNDQELWVDGVNIQGWVLRGARQNAVYDATDPIKIKVITDEVAKDDTIVASDDSGLMGRLAYAEYLRVSSTPIVGTFTIPIANDLLPGQKIRIQAKKKRDGSFRIDKDFRVTRVIHSVTEQGFISGVDVTDDLKNANPRPMPTQLNVLLGAVRPEFQDRQAASIKTREIDITQPILEKKY